MCDVDNLLSSFYNKFNKIVNKYAPLRALSKRKVKELCKPWITKGLRVSIRIMNKLYASGDISNYKVYRNKICSLTRISKQQYYFKFFDFLSQTKSPESSFVFDPVTREEVKLEIGSIPNNKSHGLYSCPPRLLKCSANVISGVLADMINSSILNRVYPSKLKMAKIVPVYKLMMTMP